MQTKQTQPNLDRPVPRKKQKAVREKKVHSPGQIEQANPRAAYHFIYFSFLSHIPAREVLSFSSQGYSLFFCSIFPDIFIMVGVKRRVDAGDERNGKRTKTPVSVPAKKSKSSAAPVKASKSVVSKKGDKGGKKDKKTSSKKKAQKEESESESEEDDDEDDFDLDDVDDSEIDALDDEDDNEEEDVDMEDVEEEEDTGKKSKSADADAQQSMLDWLIEISLWWKFWY